MQDVALLQDWLPDLPAPAATELAGLLEPFSVPGGTRLFRQEDPGDGVWLLSDGAVRVESRPPGDGIVIVARLGPAAVLGEMALLDGGNRSAAAVAESDAGGFRLNATAFHALKAARRPAALAVQAHLQATMAARLVSQLEQLAGSMAPAEPLPAPPAPVPAPDAAALLASFPGFAGWPAALWQEFTARLAPFAAPRGAPLLAAGAPPALFVVARGAVRVHAGAEQLLLHGPGTLPLLGPALTGRPVPVAASVAEDCIGWHMASDTLAELLAEGGGLALRLRDLADMQLARDLRRLSRVRGRRAAMRSEREAG
jgi:CRP-like cAMP-binding protein